MQPKTPGVSRWSGGRFFQAPAFGISLAILLFLWGGIDQIHFALSNDNENLSALRRAAEMNPYDSALKARIASAESSAGKRDEAVATLQQAVALSPQNIGLQHQYARAMIEDGRYSDAYAHYRKMLQLFPRDVDALVNYGLLAARLGQPDEAVDSWEKAVDVNPNQTNAQLYLAEALDRKGEHAAAARHWEIFLRLAASQPDTTAVTSEQIISASVQLADDESAINQPDAALARYRSAVALAEIANNLKLESLALAHLADCRIKEKIPQPPLNPISAVFCSTPKPVILAAKLSIGSITANFFAAINCPTNWPTPASSTPKICWRLQTLQNCKPSKPLAARSAANWAKRLSPPKKICPHCSLAP